MRRGEHIYLVHPDEASFGELSRQKALGLGHLGKNF
jgi:hypothetical protein